MKKVLCVLLAVSMILCFTACSSKDTPETVVNTFCESLKTYDYETMATCMENGSDVDNDFFDEDDGEATVLIKNYCIEQAGKLTYTIDSIEKENDTAIVNVTI